MTTGNKGRGYISLFAAVMLCEPISWICGYAQAAGSLGNGLSAAAIARGGTMVAAQSGPLDAVQGNPAGLAGTQVRTLDLSGVGIFASGSFKNAADSNGSLRPFAGALPYAALETPIGHSRFVVAAAVTPEFLMRAAWHYTDPAGTANVSYGAQKNESAFLAARASTTVACAPGSRWAFGASLGLVYNQNLLHAPYIFQQQPQLAGLKVLLDLHTQGFGWNGSAGGQWQPNPRLRFGGSWKSSTYVPSHGYAQGSASALFSALSVTADPAYHYEAEVDNHLPQSAAAGLRWQLSRKAVFSFDGGWTGWSSAFSELPVKLKDGTNAVINSVAGSAAVQDEIPLHWHHQGSFRTGVELPVHQWTGRAGYSYLSNAVPSSTLTPLTAAILRHSVAAGLGWKSEGSSSRTPLGITSWGYDVAYQAQLPASRYVGVSSLKAGEYSNTSIQVMSQSVTLSTHFAF